MGRKRAVGNERLGEHVQRRSGGALELRFPIPEDVRAAFLDGHGRPRSQITRSLGTSDVRLANREADRLRVEVRADIERVRAARGSYDLNAHLQGIYDAEMSDFGVRRASDQSRRRDVFFSTVARSERASKDVEAGTVRRKWHGAALTSGDPEERRAVAGWAADKFFSERGEPIDRASPTYAAVADECARVLADSVMAQQDIEEGRVEPTPSSERLRRVLERDRAPSNALSDRGSYPISRYFEEVYASAATSGPTKTGERNIPGKRHSVALFCDLMGDLPVSAISKGKLWEFLDKLRQLPDSRSLSGPQRLLAKSQIIDEMKRGSISIALLSPKTVNKHVTALTTVVGYAEKRRDIGCADVRGVHADCSSEDQGRSFTTAELNRILQQPLFAGCQGDQVELGLFKPGPVMVRDDRFWIPLLLLFTGARSSEIAGLLTSEADVEHAVPHLLIQPNSVRRLKNTHSRRMVPLHSRVLSAGFREFVRSRSGTERLFPMAVATTYRDGATGATMGRAVSNSLILRQFNRTILDHADARSDRGSIKCFRNTFEQESLAQIGSDEFRQRLTGRKVLSTSRIYTDNIPRDEIKKTALLGALAFELERITFSGVGLDHLVVPRTPQT